MNQSQARALKKSKTSNEDRATKSKTSPQQKYEEQKVVLENTKAQLASAEKQLNLVVSLMKFMIAQDESLICLVEAFKGTRV